jgi:DNA repair protein RecN (Recombination protein N)
MLTALSIQNVVIIEKLAIEFKAGLCALTGETGAGKSILLDSLGLATGSRADSGLVRKGAEQASVSAVFEVPTAHPSRTVLQDADLEWDTTLILRRVLGADGRSKAFINDQPVSAGLLRQVGESLLEIHGQFDTQGLLDPSTHRGILDAYAGGESRALATLWDRWKEKLRAVQDLQDAARTAKTDEEFLRAAIEDLDGLSPEAGEEEELAALRERLMHREKVLEGLNAAYHALSGEHDPVRAAMSALDRLSDKTGEAGQAIMAALERASAEMQEAVSAIQSLSADMEHSEHDLESIDDRLFALRGQARKHNCTVDELAAKREELALRLNRIEHSDDLIADALKAADLARGLFVKSAEAVSKQRVAAASKLNSLVATELPPLKLERARFETKVEPLPEPDWGPDGLDRVRFLVATNPGAEAGPLNKIASGGEMSRFMLAIKVVMAETGAAGTLIFDEVDAGIGGAVADAVGERLARLAKDKQILVVTHSPQVAARASHHWIVRKDGKESVTTSVLHLPEFPARREEIARMLSGASITEEARAAADKLLESAA